MRKRILSLLLLLALLLSLAPAASAAAPEAVCAADTLHTLGLFQGVGTAAGGAPDYALDRAPTRQEAVAMLVRLLGREKDAKAGSWTTPFTDVDAWAEPYVGYAYEHGLSNGSAADRFGGGRPVSASEYLTLVLRAMGYSSETDFAWDSAWTLSDRLGITDGSYNAAAKTFTRGDAVRVSLGALRAQKKTGGVTLAASLGLTVPAEELSVHFLDVGQADCILAGSGGRWLLIDAGNNDDSDAVVAYLKKMGVTSLDYAIGTHPHEDHIGGMDAVIRNFPVGKLILPPKETTTATFEDVLDAAAETGLSVTAPQVGTSYALGSAAFTIVAPNGDYGDELNNWSVGVRLTCGQRSFLLCGDAEAEAEADMLKNGQTLRSDVLKVGHHGSDTSTSPAFLAAIAPEWAVISCGKNNSYGHPDAQTLSRLAAAGVKLFRTDEQGTITAASNGSILAWSTLPVADTAANPGTAQPSQPEAGGDSVLPGKPPASSGIVQPAVQTKYVLNTSTKKFHLPGCRYAGEIAVKNRQESAESRAELIAQGYSPCGVCNP